jgi:hypothetical protein
MLPDDGSPSKALESIAIEGQASIHTNIHSGKQG